MLILKNNKQIKINNTEKKIFEKMLNSPGKVFSRESIGKLIKIDRKPMTFHDSWFKIYEKLTRISKKYSRRSKHRFLNDFYVI